MRCSTIDLGCIRATADTASPKHHHPLKRADLPRYCSQHDGAEIDPSCVWLSDAPICVITTRSTMQNIKGLTIRGRYAVDKWVGRVGFAPARLLSSPIRHNTTYSHRPPWNYAIVEMWENRFHSAPTFRHPYTATCLSCSSPFTKCRSSVSIVARLPPKKVVSDLSMMVWSTLVAEPNSMP